MNLATNARQAMGPAGGVLEMVVVSRRVERGQEPTAVGIAPGDYVLVEVSDSGPGVSAEIRDRIFEPFFTTREVGSGTGLGLSVVHGIVKDHGGAVVCATSPRGGALFRVYLPEGGLLPAPLAAGALTADTNERAGVRVLLVDDDHAVLYVGQALLEELGHAVTAAPGPQPALEVFARDPFRFDLAILDEQMPRMPGSALLRELRRVRPDLPVIIASGQGALTAGAQEGLPGVHWLDKPYELAELKRQVEQALRARP